jgi:hypothetical protein
MERPRVTYRPAVLDPTDNEKWLRKDICEGEERLMIAVLKDAVDCFQNCVLAQNPREQELLRQEEEWFLEKDSKEPFSFENICETLQLDPDYLRQGLMSWKKAKLKGII